MFFEFHKASDLSLQDAVRPPKPDILLKKDHSPPPRAVIFFAPFPVYMQSLHANKYKSGVNVHNLYT